MRIAAVIALLALAACAAGEPLPPIQGPWISLNPDHWQPSEAEQEAIKGLPER
jgi:hypothetical protein